MTRCSEQLRHNIGYVFSIVRTIANTIAGQPIMVGQARSGKQKWSGPGRLVNKSKQHLKQWKRRRLRERAKQLRMQALIPKSLPRRSNVKLVPDHPFNLLMARPNPLMGKFALITCTFTCLELCGVAYWWFRKVQSDDGTEGLEVYPIPPNWVEPVHSGDKLFVSYKLTPEGFAIPFDVPGEEIAMFYYPDPRNPAMPLSPMQALDRTVSVDENIEESQRRAHLNGHNPGLAVIVGKMPGQEGLQGPDVTPILTVEQRAQIVNTLNQEWRGAKNYNNPIVLDGFIKDVKKITSSIVEMDFLNSSKASKERLSQCWGVSPMILGDMQNANRAGSVVAKKHFYDIVINPRIAMFSEALTNKIAPMFDDGVRDESLLVWIESCVAVDEDYELNADTSMVDRDTMTINEWRLKRGMEPREGCDMTLSEWRSENGFAPDPSLQFTDDLDVPNSDDDESDSSSDAKDKKKHAKRNKIRHKSWHSQIGAAGHARMVDKHVAKTEAQMVEALQGFFTRMGVEVGEQIRTHARSSSVITPALVDMIVHSSEWSEKLTDTIRPHLLRSAIAAATIEWNVHQPRKVDHGGIDGLMQKGLFGRIMALPKAIADVVRRAADRIASKFRAVSVLETVKDKIKNAIEACADSIPTKEIADAVTRAVFSTSACETHAATIARAENTAAAGAGSRACQDHLAEVGLINARQWVHMMDDRVRPTHLSVAMDGPIGLHEKFVVGGYECDYPGDPELPASERCGCRCHAVGVYVESVKKLTRPSHRKNAPNIDPSIYREPKAPASQPDAVKSLSREIEELKAMVTKMASERQAQPINISMPGVHVTNTQPSTPPAPSVSVGGPTIHMPEIVIPKQDASIVNVTNAQPAPVVNVAAPIVNVEPPKVEIQPPVVNVAAPEVKVDVQAPPPAVVNVAAPEVKVDVQAPPPAVVNVQPAEVQVSLDLPDRKTVTTPIRDADGNIVRTESIETSE